MKKIYILLILIVLVFSIGWGLTFNAYNATSGLRDDYNSLQRNFETLQIGFNALAVENAELKGENAQLKEVKIIRVQWPTSGWATRAQLLRWLAQDPTDHQSHTGSYTCENYALDLQEAAQEDGYKLGLLEVKIRPNDFFWHAKNYAIINNIIYEIEPQTDRVKPLPSDLPCYGW